jgi:hypothetical protein
MSYTFTDKSRINYVFLNIKMHYFNLLPLKSLLRENAMEVMFYYHIYLVHDITDHFLMFHMDLSSQFKVLLLMAIVKMCFSINYQV